MDAATAAAIAALIVSIVALTAALAQAIQQYLITGLLIRMCDSVVYGKMPGKGRRVWQYSQFRFRVVYSIPQVGLRPSLWPDGFPHQSSYTKGHLSLPDLRHSSCSAETDFRRAMTEHSGRQPRSAYSAVPGEASWLSFCRAVQHSSGNDLFYEMVDGDADRCPADLPVVPMQVSMRDIVTIALMAGMTCTDASFERKSLAMEGNVGTITSSRHPILGALIRFSPRNSHQPQGLRIGDGSVNPQWMVRMWDVIVVAGRQYTLRERRHIEAYEGHYWVMLSRDRTVAKVSPTTSFSRSSSPAFSLRKRRNSSVSIRSHLHHSSTTGMERLSGVRAEAADIDNIGDFDTPLPRSPHDGDWSFETEESESAAPNSVLNSYVVEVKDYEKMEDPSQSPLHPRPQSYAPRAAARSSAMYREGRKLLDGLALEHYIEEKRNARSTSPVSPIRRGLLLTWPTEEWEAAVDVQAPDEWRDSQQVLRQERTQLYLRRWRDIVDRRQQKREERDSQDQRERTRSVSSRPSSLGPGERSARRRSTGGRSVSVDSRRSQGSSYSLHDGNRSRSTGRHRGRSPGPSGSQEWGPREERLVQSDAELTPGSNSPERIEVSRDDHLIAYGDEPVSAPLHITDLEEASGESGAERNWDAARRRKAHVGFQVDDSADEEPPNLPNHPIARFRVDPSENEDAERPTTESEIDEDENFQQKRIEIVEPLQKSASDPPQPVKSILRAPRKRFPEDKETIREGVAPHKEAGPTGAPAGARWTKIDRRLVSPAAVEEAFERFEERRDHVIVLRVLKKEEIQALAERTQAIRDERYRDLQKRHGRKGERDDEDGSKRYHSPLRPEVFSSPDSIDSRSPERTSMQERGPSLKAGEVGASMETKDPARREARFQEEGGITNNSSSATRSKESTQASYDSRLSESPTGISESEEEIGSSHGKLRARRPFKQTQYEERDRIRRDSNTSQGSGNMRTSFAKESRPRPAPRSKTSGHDIRGSSRRSNVSPATSHRDRAESTFSRTDSVLEHVDISPYLRSKLRQGSMSSNISLPDNPQSDEDEWEATELEDHQQLQHDNYLLHDSNSIDNQSTATVEEIQAHGAVNWLWICQADIIPGYFATPWQNHFPESTCFGAIAVMLEALHHFTDASTLIYVDKQSHCEDWLHRGKTTYPSYAINAMGGIIVSGKYKRAKFDALETCIPPIELLRSYDNQVNRSRSLYDGTTTRTTIERLAELMSLDSWLSFCGRLPEICNGRNNLLHSTPALVQKIMTDFEYEFRNLDRTATEGGLQIIQETAELVVLALEKEMLAEEEQLFAVVALLRAAKMALSVVQGPSTGMLGEILMKDVRVYLV